MGDIVVLRNLIRSASIRDQSFDADVLFRKVHFDSRPSWYPVGYQRNVTRMYNYTSDRAQ